jgi:hypothetical protein
MAQLVIESSDPTDGDSDVFVNVALDVVFTTDVLSSTVSSTSVTLTNAGSLSILSADVELVSSDTIRITPYGSLAEDTTYKIRFPGTDIALSDDYVLKDALDGDALIGTLTVTFTTGSRSYIDQTDVDKDATDLSLEGDLSLPVHVKALGNFAISDATPNNHSYDVVVDTPLTLVFNQPLATGSFEQSWLEIDVFPILDDEAWLASGDAYGGSIPGYVVAASGSTLTVSFSGDLPQNVGVQVQVSPDVLASGGNEYGPNDYLLSFSTDRYPEISGVHVIRREIKAAADELNDDYIASVLFSKTVEAESKFGIDAVPHISLVKWVVNSTIVDILDDVELEKAIVAGTRRQLGDMNISIDPVIGKLSLKHARAQKKIDDATKSLLGKKMIAMHYRTDFREGLSRPSRMWYGVSGKIRDTRFITHQGNHPASNTSTNREAKIQPDHNWWGGIL